MKRDYECMLLLDNREVKQGWDQLKDAVNGVFTKFGAEVLSSRRWDERRLTYPIRGQQRGTYLLVYFNAETDANVQIRRDLELSEKVLRYMISACEEVPQQAYEPEEAFDLAAIPDGAEPVAEAAAEPKEPAAEEKAESEPSGDEQPAEDKDDKDDKGDKEDTEASAKSGDEEEVKA